MTELSVDSRELEGIVLLYPRGFINAHTVRLFEGEIQKALDQGRYRIVVSGADLKYIASAGLGAIMGVVEEIRTNGGDIRLAELRTELTKWMAGLLLGQTAIISALVKLL